MTISCLKRPMQIGPVRRLQSSLVRPAVRPFGRVRLPTASGGRHAHVILDSTEAHRPMTTVAAGSCCDSTEAGQRVLTGLRRDGSAGNIA